MLESLIYQIYSDPSYIFYKVPLTYFTVAEITVHDHEEAFYFVGGTLKRRFVYDGPALLGSGTKHIYTSLLEATARKEVCYINQLARYGVDWETRHDFVVDDEINLMKTRVTGSFSVKVYDDAEKLLWIYKRKGNFGMCELSEFASRAATPVVKEEIARRINSKKTNLVRINEHLTELSGVLKRRLSDSFDEIGLTLTEFTVEDIVIDTNDMMYEMYRMAKAFKNIDKINKED